MVDHLKNTPLNSIGFPTTNGFIGEFLILLGAFKANKAAAVLAATGVVLGAVYMLWMVQRVFYGEVTNPKNLNLKDLSRREFLYLLPLVGLIFWIGLFPNFFLGKMHKSVDNFISRVKIQYESIEARETTNPIQYPKYHHNGALHGEE